MTLQTSVSPATCSVCRFSLYTPVATLTRSSLGLYGDNRFPGRCILTLHQHFDHFEDLPTEIMNDFTRDINESIQAIKQVTSSTRVNIAILGNAESHVHAHLIPRYSLQEQFPQQSPWNDPRPLQPLEPSHKETLRQTLALHFDTYQEHK